MAVLLMNHAAANATLPLAFADVPGSPCTSACKVRDLWAHKDLGTFTGTYTPPALLSHDSAFLLLTPA